MLHAPKEFSLDDYLNEMAKMGRAAAFSLRRILRQAGATVEPGCTIYVQGEPCVQPTRSLDWLPGEEEWNRERDEAERPR